MASGVVSVALAVIVLAACAPVAAGTSDGGIGSCGEGTVDVNGVCEPSGGGTCPSSAPLACSDGECCPAADPYECNGVCYSASGSCGSSSITCVDTSGTTGNSVSGQLAAILNGPTAAASSTHWAFNGEVISFYGDQTGTYSVLWASGLACPGVCVAPLTPCGAAGACTNTSTDPDNCGDCGQKCPTSTECTSGACVTVSGSSSGGGSGSGSGGPSLGGGNPQPGVFKFTWSAVNADGILLTSLGAPQEVPFVNLTQISGGVSDANFSGVSGGARTVNFTLVSGPACLSQ